MKTIVLGNFELPREIDKDDKFFIVKVSIGGFGMAEIGWIEKEFIESDFVKVLPYSDFEIKEVIEFDNKDDYEQYRKPSDKEIKIFTMETIGR